MENFISNQTVSVMFNKLRASEKIKMGQFSSCLKPIDIFKILINARYKQENKIENSDLEKKIKAENGNMIVMYVSEKWTLIKNQYKINSIPFPEFAHISLKDIEKFLIKNKNYNYLKAIG